MINARKICIQIVEVIKMLIVKSVLFIQMETVLYIFVNLVIDSLEQNLYEIIRVRNLMKHLESER